MALAYNVSSGIPSYTPSYRGRFVREALVKSGLYDDATAPSTQAESPVAAANVTQWRLAPTPFWLSSDDVSFFQSLGQHLLSFYRALNSLYMESARGTQPAWVSAYLDQGKPESLLTYSRMKRFRDHLPGVIRPDIIPTDHGMVITELDSVPGGIGLTGSLSHAYNDLATAAGERLHLVGGANGLVERFAAMVRDLLGNRPGCLAIVISEEAKDYRAEMTWLAAQLRANGLTAYCVSPRDLRFTEEGLWVHGDAGSELPVAVLYRFFELFDLKNVPKSELIMYSAKKDKVLVTPPFKPALEEKLAFALLHHPILAPFWNKELGGETFDLLTAVMPRTWILDPRPLPPSAIIPHLTLGGRAVSDWRTLANGTQKERRYVVKPSGFSELAWGSRGVAVGHDLPQAEWAAALDTALNSFPMTPYILQEFHKGRQFDLSYFDAQRDAIVPMVGRARLSPYYFVNGGRADLAGILATVCSPEKKIIHGMKDAIMAPCALAAEPQ
ncbi:MAG TPA: hypothetical protein VFI05_06980 [Nitrospiraceae bacterium]|nr:hypothetical protein [Nitrospiraceae bacterium]